MEKSSRTICFAEYICILGTILIMYGFGVFNFYILSTIFCVFVYKSIKGRVTFSYSKSFAVYIIGFYCCRLFHLDIADIPLGTLLMIAFLGFFQAQCTVGSFIKVYRKIANLNVAMFLLQYIVKAITGIGISGVFFFLPVSAFEDPTEIQDRMINLRERFSGFFSEPAHLAVFLLPLISIELFYSKDKHSMIRAIIYTIIIVLSQSGCGMFGIIVISVFYVIYKMKSMSVARIIPYVISFTILVSLAGFVAFNTEFGGSMVERQSELDTDPGNGSSGYVRVVRGYYLIEKMTTFELLLGASNESVVNYAYRSPFFMGYERGDMIYINFFQRLLIYGGFVTTFLFFRFVVKTFKEVNYAGKCCLGILVAMSLMVAMNYSPDMLLLLTTIFMMRNNLNNRNTKCISI